MVDYYYIDIPTKRESTEFRKHALGEVLHTCQFSDLTLTNLAKGDPIILISMGPETPRSQGIIQNEQWGQDLLCSLKPLSGFFHQSDERVLSKNSLIYLFIHLIPVLYPKIIVKQFQIYLTEWIYICIFNNTNSNYIHRC